MKDMSIIDIIEERIDAIPCKGTRDADFIEIGMRLCYGLVLDYLTEEELTKIRKNNS